MRSGSSSTTMYSRTPASAYSAFLLVQVVRPAGSGNLDHQLRGTDDVASFDSGLASESLGNPQVSVGLDLAKRTQDDRGVLAAAHSLGRFLVKASPQGKILVVSPNVHYGPVTACRLFLRQARPTSLRASPRSARETWAGRAAGRRPAAGGGFSSGRVRPCSWCSPECECRSQSL